MIVSLANRTARAASIALAQELDIGASVNEVAGTEAFVTESDGSQLFRNIFEFAHLARKEPQPEIFEVDGGKTIAESSAGDEDVTPHRHGARDDFKSVIEHLFQ
jgi:hypothetical protein